MDAIDELKEFVMRVGVAVGFTVDGIKFTVCPRFDGPTPTPVGTVVRYDDSSGNQHNDCYGIADHLVEVRTEMIKDGRD